MSILILPSAGRYLLILDGEPVLSCATFADALGYVLC